MVVCCEKVCLFIRLFVHLYVCVVARESQVLKTSLREVDRRYHIDAGQEASIHQFNPVAEKH